MQAIKHAVVSRADDIRVEKIEDFGPSCRDDDKMEDLYYSSQKGALSLLSQWGAAKLLLGKKDRNIEGKLLWSFDARDNILGAPSASHDGIVYAGSNDKRVYAIDERTGTKIWEFNTGNCVSSSPVASPDGTVYCGSGDGKVYALDGKTGKLKWELNTGCYVDRSPALGNDGTVYAVSNNGGLSGNLIVSGRHGRVYALSPCKKEALFEERPSQKLSNSDDETQAPPGREVVDEDGYILIDGIRLEKNKAA